MKQANATPPLRCGRARVLLQFLLDGELQGARLERFQAHLRACAACRGELQAARRIQSELRALPQWECPPEVSRQVIAWVEAQEGASLGRRLAAWLRRRPVLWRPALAGVGVAVTALLIALAARQPPGPARRGAEPQVRAEQEARWALAYVAHVTRQSSDRALSAVMDEVVGDVIGGSVVAPVTHAVRSPLKEDGS